MNHRYFLKLSYNGSGLNGWQIQSNTPNTVQQLLQDALGTVLKAGVKLVGCGRTDTGVHAEEYFAHFDSASIVDPKTLCYKLNSILPWNVAVNEIIQVIDGASARYDATARTYRYLISKVKDPFKHNKAYFFYPPLDVGLMNSAAGLLLEENDFASFCKKGSDNENTLCNVSEALWSENERLLVFKITANRFLRNMVRAIVGTLIEVGEGKITVNEFKSIVKSRSREKAGYSVPGEGLYLHKVEYPSGIFIKT